MGIQDQLRNALIYFSEGALRSPGVYIHPPDLKNLFRYCVVVSGEHKGKTIKASSSGKSLYTTFIKAVSELGENIICDELNLDCRSGIAGGLFKKNCIHRAKAELIERDAFLFHYRKGVPFRKERDEKGYSAFILNSIDPEFKVSFVMNQDYLTDPEACLVFGMGCDDSFRGSFEKAFSEYTTMHLNHHLFECKKQISPSPESWSSKADFHHGQSRSVENKFIFKKLCFSSFSDAPRSYNPHLWQIEVLKSPFRFIQFIKATHPQLEKLKFGEPEISFHFINPVYHPFW